MTQKVGKLLTAHIVVIPLATQEIPLAIQRVVKVLVPQMMALTLHTVVRPLVVHTVVRLLVGHATELNVQRVVKELVVQTMELTVQRVVMPLSVQTVVRPLVAQSVVAPLVTQVVVVLLVVHSVLDPPPPLPGQATKAAGAATTAPATAMRFMACLLVMRSSRLTGVRSFLLSSSLFMVSPPGMSFPKHLFRLQYKFT